MDDSGWSPKLDLVETGSIVPIGRINVFVGMVCMSSPGLQYSNSVSEAGSMEQSDGEESVGTVVTSLAFKNLKNQKNLKLFQTICILF